jgi:hypothetical protein
MMVPAYSLKLHNSDHSFTYRATQGVLASKFPISILAQTQGQHRCQKIRKILKKCVPVSDFATRQMNLRKPQNSQKFWKKIFRFGKKCNSKSKEHFSWYFLSILNICFIENIFWPKNNHINQRNYKMGGLVAKSEIGT